VSLLRRFSRFHGGKRTEVVLIDHRRKREQMKQNKESVIASS